MNAASKTDKLFITSIDRESKRVKTTRQLILSIRKRGQRVLCHLAPSW
jgi:hypothetical protein